MIAIVACTLAALLALLVALENVDQESVVMKAGSSATVSRIHNVRSIVEGVPTAVRDELLDRLSRCQDGFFRSAEPMVQLGDETILAKLGHYLGTHLGIPAEDVLIDRYVFEQSDFSFSKCKKSEDISSLTFPLKGLVISARIGESEWLNFEVHPNEWRLDPLVKEWALRATLAFLILGGIAVLFVRRLVRPIADLAGAARRFGRGMSVGIVEERGPEDLRVAIRSFNSMQKKVSQEVERRSNTLAAISHDIRTPLTAIRMHAEMIDKSDVRERLITNVDRIEQITSSALDFLRGESRSEAIRRVDLDALVTSECTDFSEIGQDVSCEIRSPSIYPCRPNALARALRNLIENALKYAGHAKVILEARDGDVAIVVEDQGPGIPEDRVEQAIDPFYRLSSARESGRGGFGLGLAIVQAVATGHDGELVLEPNQPQGLRASIILPASESVGTE